MGAQTRDEVPLADEAAGSRQQEAVDAEMAVT